MNFNRESSPVNLAFKNIYNENQKVANILPPYIESNYKEKITDTNFDDLKEFRSRILEMDDEIKQLKQNEREKNFQQQKMEYKNPESDIRPKLILKDEAVSTTECLLQEQTSRIADLERQFEQLVLKNHQNKYNELSNTNFQPPKKNENENFDYKKLDLDDQITQRIGNWTPKDPYQGPMQNLYFPFGSPGGGAPRRDNYGKIQTSMVGYQNINSEERKQKFLASQCLQESSQQDILQQRLKRLQDKQQTREPNGDFSDIISSLKVGRPKRDPLTGMLVDNHLPSSDVTNIKLVSPRASSPGPQINNYNSNVSGASLYGMELTRAAKERQIMKHLDKLREQQECRQHVEAWNSIWGNRDRPETQKTYSSNDSPTISSNHRNFYQITDPTM